MGRAALLVCAGSSGYWLGSGLCTCTQLVDFLGCLCALIFQPSSLVYTAGSELPEGPDAPTFFTFVLVSTLLLSHRPKQVTWPSPELIAEDITKGRGCRRHKKMKAVIVVDPLQAPKLEFLRPSIWPF